MRKIENYNLWLGNVGDLTALENIYSAGISVIVDLALNEPPLKLPREFIYCRFPLNDGQGNPDWLLKAAIEFVALMLEKNVATLIFCSAGMSRSPCIAGAAIAKYKHLSFNDCLKFVCESGKADISPQLFAVVQKVLMQ